VEVERPRFDASKMIQIVEDKAKEGKIQRGRKTSCPKGKTGPKRSQGDSRLSRNTERPGLLDQVLNAKSGVGCWEVIGCHANYLVSWQMQLNSGPQVNGAIRTYNLSAKDYPQIGQRPRVIDQDNDGNVMEGRSKHNRYRISIEYVSEKACKSSILRDWIAR